MELLSVIKQNPLNMFGVLALIPEFSKRMFEISPTYTPCSVTYTVKIIKITAIILTIIQTVTCWIITLRLNKKETGSLKHIKLRNFWRNHALYQTAVLLSGQLKVKVRLSTLRTHEKRKEQQKQTYFVGVHKLWVKNLIFLSGIVRHLLTFICFIANIKHYIRRN